MLYIATRRLVVTTILAFASAVTTAKDAPPRILQEPVLGLRLEAANVKLDSLPEDVRALCLQTADNERRKGRLWVFARAVDAAATFYVVAGYFQRLHPGPGEPQYEMEDRGGVLTIAGNKCSADGPARDVFEAQDFNETPQPVLQQLANDLAARLARAFGGPDRLRAELRNQRIDRDRLSPELQEAFKPYFGSEMKAERGAPRH